jgi:hypothetical protein
MLGEVIKDEVLKSEDLKQGQDSYSIHVWPDSKSRLPETLKSPRPIQLDALEDQQWFIGEGTQNLLFLIASSGLPSSTGLRLDTAMPVGLLLRRSPKQNDAWERICFVASTRAWRDWKLLAVKQEILLL